MRLLAWYGRTIVALGAISLAFSVSQAAPPTPPPLEAYGNLPEIEQMAISPNGREIAVVSRSQGQRKLVILEDMTKVKVAYPIGDVKIRSLIWGGNEQVLFAISKTIRLGVDWTRRQNEMEGVTIIPISGGKPMPVFAKANNLQTIVQGIYGVRQIGGRWHGFFGGVAMNEKSINDSKSMDTEPGLYDVDLASGMVHKVANPHPEGKGEEWVLDGAGRICARLLLDGDQGHWSVDNANGKRLASGIQAKGNIEIESLGTDGTTVIYQVDDASDLPHYMEVPLAGGEPKEILADEAVRGLIVDPTNNRLLGYSKWTDPDRPILFDPAKQFAITKAHSAFPKLHVSVLDWTPDFGHLIVRTSGTDDSGTYYAVDMNVMSASAVGYERLAIAPEQVGPVSVIEYKAADGLAMDGILTLPPGREPKNLPVVMFPHGGPQAFDHVEFDWWAQAFASRGYAVFQPNFRGSTNRDAAFRNAGRNEWGRKMQSDISDGLAELAKRGIVDPKRACIMGGSYGGYAAMAGITLQHGIYRCAVADAGVSDLRLMYQYDVPVGVTSAMSHASMRDFLGDPSGYAAASPRFHAAQADAPILLTHGTDDTVVPIQQSQMMYDALKAAGKPVEMVVMAGEDHWLSTSGRLKMLTAAVNFVEKYNPPD